MTTSLATHSSMLVPSRKDIPSAPEWEQLLQMGQYLVESHFLPATVNTPQKAVTIMLKGRELGVPPLYALSKIYVHDGRASCEAELMLALIYRDHGDEAIHFLETSSVMCTVEYRRRGWTEYRTYTFSVEDAHRAGLMSKATWKQHTPAMLRARCISAVARMAFPDSIGGMYTPEELGQAVNEEGEVIASSNGIASEERVEPTVAPEGRVLSMAEAFEEQIRAAGSRRRIRELAQHMIGGSHNYTSEEKARLLAVVREALAQPLVAEEKF